MKENGYRLGIDLGTTFSAVGLAKEGSYSVVPLTDHQRDVPSTVYVAADGTVTVGEAAEALGNQRPTAIAREFKRRLGDPVPLIVDGRPFSPQALMAHVLRWTVGAATDRTTRPDHCDVSGELGAVQARTTHSGHPTSRRPDGHRLHRARGSCCPTRRH